MESQFYWEIKSPIEPTLNICSGSDREIHSYVKMAAYIQVEP